MNVTIASLCPALSKIESSPEVSRVMKDYGL
jgi:hypothetical protein